MGTKSGSNYAVVARFSVWLLSAFLLAGCAGVGGKKGSSQDELAKSGKRGFTISETSEIDGKIRDDFDAAIALLKAEEYQKGIDLLTKVIQNSPRRPAPYVNLAIAYQKLGDMERAEENIKKALAISPDHPAVNNEYGLIYRKTGRFAEARASYEKILQKYPDFLPARKNLGVLCDLYLKDLSCALENYQIYMAAIPDKTMGIWIADLQRRQGQ